MRRLLLAALAATSLCATPASALNGPDGIPTYYQFHIEPTNPAKHIMIVTDDRRAGSNGGNQQNARLDQDKVIANLVEVLSRESGCDVHVYSSRYFTSNTYGSALWRNAGSFYAAAVMPYWDASGATEKNANDRKKFFSADSTNMLILHIGGTNPGQAWNDVASLGTCDSMPNATSAITPDTITVRYAVSYIGSDSLTGKMGYALSRTVRPAGVSQVYRLFNPVAIAGPGVGSGVSNWIKGADSSKVNLQDRSLSDSTVWATSTDGTGGCVQPMPLAYRVQWSSGRSVYFMPMPNSPSVGDCWGTVAYSIIARAANVNAIPYSYEWDDIADDNPTTRSRITDAAFDTLKTYLAAYTVTQITTNLNTNSAALYLQGQVPSYESAWTGSSYGWMRRFPAVWTHHAHDSSEAVTGGLLGRFGGYSTGNGSRVGASGAASFHSYYTPRVANAWQPGGTSGLEAVGQEFGITQRLLYGDSLRRAYCPECIRPPYLTFPNNEMLPINWKTHGAVVWSGGAAPYSAWTKLCPVDSLFWAFHVGSGLAAGDKIFLRGTFFTGSASNSYYGSMLAPPDPWGDFSVMNNLASFDRDSVPAATVFPYGGERLDYIAAGRFIKVRNVAAVAVTGRLAVVSDVMIGGWRSVETVLGFMNQAQRGGCPDVADNVAFTNDPNKLKATTGFTPVNFTCMNRPRTFYQHPNTANYVNVNGIIPTTNATGPQGNSEIQNFLSGVGQHLKCMNDLSGRKLVRCVRPWELYEQ